MNVLKAVFTFYMSDSNPVVSSISECRSQSNITGKNCGFNLFSFEERRGCKEKTDGLIINSNV